MEIIAHRANSLKAIQKALEQKVDKIEIDVRLDSKGQAVLSHDTPNKDCLALGDALESIGGKYSVIVEIKPSEPVDPIVEILKKHKSVEVASFDIEILSAIKKLLPETPLTVLDKWSGVRASRRARKLGTPYIAMNQRWLWSGFIRSMAASGFKLSAYTLNDPVKARRWANHGLYGVVTDYPDRFM